LRQRTARQQLIAGHRQLLALLILHIHLQQRVGADVPVEGEREEITLAIGVIDIRADILVRQVGAQAELLLAAESAADIGG